MYFKEQVGVIANASFKSFRFAELKDCKLLFYSVGFSPVIGANEYVKICLSEDEITANFYANQSGMIHYDTLDDGYDRASAEYNLHGRPNDKDTLHIGVYHALGEQAKVRVQLIYKK